ncbi:MAG TPA: hypothetical protein VK281_07655, partial [Xanthobacteraceae bacterium]|nr:hypothetical protein [Xanthobacteraceae bacterium]
PSGEIANDTGSGVAGVTMSVRSSGGEGGGASRKYRTAGTAKTTATSPATPAAIQVSPTLKKRRNLDRLSTDGQAAPLTGRPGASSV